MSNQTDTTELILKGLKDYKYQILILLQLKCL